MFLAAAGVRSYPGFVTKKGFFVVTIFADVAVVAVALLSGSALISLICALIMNLLHGIVAGCYLMQLSVVPQQYRARIFGFGYAVGSIGTWLLSLPANGQFLKTNTVILVYLVLVAIIVLLNRRAVAKHAHMDSPACFEPKLLAHLFAVLMLLSLVKNIGFYFPASDISGKVNMEFSRAFYALGLVVAGIVNDKDRRYGAICCIASLAFPFISLVLDGKPQYTAAMWMLGYVFFGFFSVYRVVAFSDIAGEDASLLWLAPGGLLAGRMGDAVGTLGGILFSTNTVLLLVIASSLFILTVLMFFVIYHRMYTPQPLAAASEEIRHETFVHKYLLTQRENEVLCALLQGKSNAEVAAFLYVTESTVKFHVGNILRKTDCSNRSELISLYKLGSGSKKAASRV